MRIVLLICSLWALPAAAIDESELLPVEEAFALTVEAPGPERVRAHWDIAEGYYLYRGRMSFESQTPGIELGEPVKPAGKKKVDEFFGEVQTYRHGVDVEVPLIRTDPTVTELELAVKSQGCADLGVCYPPHRQIVTVSLPEAAPAASTGLSFGQASSSALLAGQDDALPVDAAFRFETIAISPTELLARWTIADGYYLYRDKIGFMIGADQPAELVDFELPPGVPMTDEHFGDVDVYYGEVEVPVQLRRTDAGAGTLMLTGMYQGCKEAGICYPPQERLIAVDLPAAPDADRGDVGTSGPGPAADDILPEQDRLAIALGEDSLWTLVMFFGFGLLLAFTPCVFPMIPILSGIIAGQGENISTVKAFWLSLVYVLAMALTYTVAGVIAGYWGYNLQAAFQNAWVLGAFSMIFVLLSLAMFGFYQLQLPASWQSRLNEMSSRQGGGTLIGVAIMGFLSALIVGPCVAPPLAAALIYIGQTGDPVLGGSALFALSLGMGAPLLVIGTSAGKLLPKAGSWMDAIKAVFGVALLALAIWMLERIAPPTLIMLLWGMLAIASGVYMGALERIPDGASGWRRLWKSLGLVLVVLGALELIGATAGGKDWMQPLKGVGFAGAGRAAQAPVEFVRIKSLDDLERELAAANKPAMLDFYADWCVDCKRMDKYTFPEPPVAAALQRGLAMKADVTANDDVDQALMRAFNIIGPPAILFFDAEGREMPRFRVIGYMKPEEFGSHVQRAFEAGAR